MRFSADLPADGLANMAADAALLASASEGEWGGRLYTWTAAWVTLGRFQDFTRDLLQPCPVPWVERPTGGRAVLHGHDLTVALAAPLAGFLVERERRSVRSIYRQMTRPLMEALRAAGVPAYLVEEDAHRQRAATVAIHQDSGEGDLGARRAWDAWPERPCHDDSPDCFAHAAPNDIVDVRTGIKVCGCALRTTDTAVLIQASIPVSEPIVDPATVFRHPAIVHPSSLDAELFASALAEAWVRAERLAADRRRSD